ncbi:probable cardiolipin synthase (CMP-forming) [Lingula anatina]|uniref:cardiolipin synthase (CMP-forming) n=1 Tax=Lingula anatina TaxID=7574 RepID=A0A1S3JVZ8_LINAN|nr:probable cardiolipin synthase (CMP-forming) [Lingula anatina]|eukprot:XP_013414580.1 probable cardiolipin synthase (CMP-forming) [Lingula anatina]
MAAVCEFRFVARTLFSFSSPYCTKRFVHSSGVNTGKRHLSTIIKIHAFSQTSRIYRKSERCIKHWRCLSNVCKIDKISFYTRSPKNTRTERLNYERRKSFPLCRIQTHPLKCSVGAFHESAIKTNDAEKKGEENTKNSVSGKNINKSEEQDTKKENILTVPNALTVSRIVLSPFLGYLVLHESYTWALGLFVYAGTTDWIDGYIARKFPSQRSALGSLIDPLGDKILMTILTVTLTQVDLLPFPLAALIIGRDVALLTGGIYIRYRMLPPPKTLSRIFNPSLSSHNVNPTALSKFNTFCQISLIAGTLGAPIFNYVDHTVLHGMWYVTGATTLLSGLSYVFSKDTYSSIQNKNSTKER